MFTVIMSSDEYGEERFSHNTLLQALTSAKELRAFVDSPPAIERTFSLLLNDESLAALTLLRKGNK